MSGWIATYKVVWVLAVTISDASSMQEIKRLASFDSVEECIAASNALHDKFAEESTDGVLVTECKMEER